MNRPPEKLDMQTVDCQHNWLFKFLTSLLHFTSGWFGNGSVRSIYTDLNALLRRTLPFNLLTAFA